MSRLIILALTLITLGAGCRYDNVRVHSYWGTTIHRPVAGSVYEWSTESGHLDPGADPRVAREIQHEIEREMASIGFVKRSGAEPPDMILSTHMGRGLQPSPSGPEQRATLGVQLYWAADGRKIYSAAADALIEPTLSPEERKKRIDRAIHEVLRPLNPCPRCRRH